MPQVYVSEPKSKWWVRDEILKQLEGWGFSRDTFEIVPLKVAGVAHNWDIRINPAWTSANTTTLNRRAQAIAEVVAKVQREHPIVDHDE